MQKNKTRDMIRSILPSKGVKGARHSRTSAHRANRKMVRQTLHQYRTDDLDEDQMVLRIHESDIHRRHDIREMVSDRRDADKINHFVRWCNKKTAHLPKEALKERYYYISGLIGGSRDIIREHALGHFIMPSDFNPYGYRWGWRYRNTQPELFDRAAFTLALTWAWETCPTKLNRALKHSVRGIGPISLTWRKCRDEDACTGSYIRKKWEYHYQNTYGWGFRTSSYEPREGDYRPGTLNKRLVEETVHTHEDRLCENRILATTHEDVERIINYVFDFSDSWRKNNYASDRSEIVSRLLKFFLDQHLLEDRS